MQAQLSTKWALPPSRCCLLAGRSQCAASLRSRHQQQQQRRAVHAAAAQQEAGLIVLIPQSREEAVAAAVAAFSSQVKGLSGGKKAKKKGFGGGSSGGSSGSSGNRFSIELPLAADSPGEVAALAWELLAALPPAAAAAGATAVFASEAAAAAAAAAAAGGKGAASKWRVLSLQAACQGSDLTGPLVLVGPTTADVALVEQLVDEVWAGGASSWLLLVNPAWAAGSVPDGFRGLVESFEAAYAFMPLATQGLMRVEGAVLRQLSGAGGSSSPWRVLIKQPGSEQFTQVGAMKVRPSQSDLELVLMNAKAAASPLTSLVRGVRGLMDKGKQQQ